MDLATWRSKLGAWRGAAPEDAALAWTPSPRMTLGVEVELQLVDRETRELAPASLKVFERLGGETTAIKHEFFQSMVEVATGICADVAAVRADLRTAIARLREATDALGLELAGAASHPVARYA